MTERDQDLRVETLSTNIDHRTFRLLYCFKTVNRLLPFLVGRSQALRAEVIAKAPLYPVDEGHVGVFHKLQRPFCCT
ncbi:MAG: hypothetical protein WB930_03595 [Syntrophobacteraceae bacterium]